MSAVTKDRLSVRKLLSGFRLRSEAVADDGNVLRSESAFGCCGDWYTN